MEEMEEKIKVPDENDDLAGDADDKSHTFRRRRLSLTNLRQYSAGTSSGTETGTDACTGTTPASGSTILQSESKDATSILGDNGEDLDASASDSAAAAAVDAQNSDSVGTSDHHLGPTSITRSAQQASEEAELRTSISATGEEAQSDSVRQDFQVQIHFDDEKALSFRKRRLSLTQREDTSSHDDANSTTDQSFKRRRRPSEASASSLDSGSYNAPNNNNPNTGTSKRLKSRTVHAAELLAHPPPSPYIANNKLYAQSAPPQKQSSLLDVVGGINQGDVARAPTPKWKKRHTKHVHEDDRNLPFPRDIVGTFSCHGVEPIYDDEVQVDDDDADGTGMDSWVLTGGGKPPVSKQGVDDIDSPSTQQHEKPTTAAKINQDRGGVAFPYGNCARTALFAVYDGEFTTTDFCNLVVCVCVCFNIRNILPFSVCRYAVVILLHQSALTSYLSFVNIVLRLGHGQGGELVAQFALHEVQRRLEKHASFADDIEKAFRETFLTVDRSLRDEVLIEPLYAGTTACVALLRENRLVLSNAGDSRAVLARRKGDSVGNKPVEWQAIDLTTDQNPDLPEEQARIESMGGFVSPPPEPGLSARVWLDVDCTQIGLAMARSIGDHAVKSIGVIADPVVTFHDICSEDDFMILATDGVWEFISSDDAVRVVAENLGKGATRACQALIELAASRWHDEEGDYRDDITALVVRLQQLWKSDHAIHQASKQQKSS